jgi:hypothetical protein
MQTPGGPLGALQMVPFGHGGEQSGTYWQVFVDESQYWLAPQVTGHVTVPPQPSGNVPHWYDWQAARAQHWLEQASPGALHVLPAQHACPSAPHRVHVELLGESFELRLFRGEFQLELPNLDSLGLGDVEASAQKLALFFDQLVGATQHVALRGHARALGLKLS